jgi:3'(2'), 5'-bisphosphate nucleotidase
MAAALASAAGRRLLRLRAGRGFADPRALKDAGDRESHEYLVAELARHRPGDAVLSEEGRDDPARLGADRVWIVDPLDGTREFGEEGRADWAVHVALWERGRLAAGAVALPAEGRTLCTTAGGAAVLSFSTARTDRSSGASGDGPGEAPGALAAAELAAFSPAFSLVGADEIAGAVALRMRGLAEDGRVRVAISRSRPPAFLEPLIAHLAERRVALEPVQIGSAGAKIAAVLLGQVDAYIHAGGQSEWDSAAPAAVALAAGAHASRVDGASLAYNQKEPDLPDILVCHPALASTLLAGIRAVTDADHPAANRKS